MFLIDDSSSMKPSWEKNEHCQGVVRVFEALSYLVKETDPNGIDVLFTVSGKRYTNCKSTTSLVAAVKSMKLQGKTDINMRLTQIFDEYKAKLSKPQTKGLFNKEPKTVRPLNLYVLTNGVWEPESHAERPIQSIVHKLVELKKDRLQIGVQFIRFGEDPLGMARLDYLDSGLNLPL